VRVVDTTPGAGFPEQVWSSAEGNYHAPYRDLWRNAGTFLKEYLPAPGLQARELDEHVGSIILYVVPGSRVTAHTQRLYSKVLHRCAGGLRRAEIEFSAPFGPSLPEQYKRAAILWALSVSDAVLICVNRRVGIAEGEAHRVLAPRQCVFRCRDADVDAWVEYLKPKLLSRHKFVVVHLADGHA
jgi:hypothetical protein